jgi:hypothetical protein
MARWAKRRWQSNALEPIQRIGGKNGRKRSLLFDARGVPLSIIVSGAITHDVKLLLRTLQAVVWERPMPRKWKPQHLCADAGYNGKAAKEAAIANNYRPHTKSNAKKRAQTTSAYRDTKPKDGSWSVLTHG